MQQQMFLNILLYIDCLKMQDIKYKNFQCNKVMFLLEDREGHSLPPVMWNPNWFNLSNMLKGFAFKNCILIMYNNILSKTCSFLRSWLTSQGCSRVAFDNSARALGEPSRGRRMSTRACICLTGAQGEIDSLTVARRACLYGCIQQWYVCYTGRNQAASHYCGWHADFAKRLGLVLQMLQLPSLSKDNPHFLIPVPGNSVSIFYFSGCLVKMSA